MSTHAIPASAMPAPAAPVVLSAAPALPPATVAHEESPDSDVEIAHSFFSTADGAFVAMVFVVALMLIARTVQAMMLHASLRKAIEAESPHAGELIAKINQPATPVRRARPTGGDRSGVVLTAIGLAMGGYGGMMHEQQAIAASLFPLLVGIGLLVHGRFAGRAQGSAEAGNQDAA